MQIVIDIPDEQVMKSLEESKYFHKDEGIKGFVNIVMLYTNGRLELVDVERREDFYSCNFTSLPKGHGDLIDRKELLKQPMDKANYPSNYVRIADAIIEADKEYEAEVITRGKCMMCGKELTEGLFFCKECEDKEVKE